MSDYSMSTPDYSGPGLEILILGPIGGLVVLIACCYCMYRCCCCCCRDKQVVVVNTTNMLQVPREAPTAIVVNNIPGQTRDFTNPGYNPQNVPLMASGEAEPPPEYSDTKY